MKRALYAVLAVVVVFSAVVVGVKLKQKGGETDIEVQAQKEVNRQLTALQNQQPNIFKGTRGKMTKESIAKSIASQARTNETLKNEAVKRGLTISDDKVEAAIGQVRAAYASPKKFDEALKKQNWDLNAYRENIKNQMLLAALMNDITKNVKVNDAEVKAFYDSHKDQYKGKSLKSIFEQVKADALAQKKSQAQQEAVQKLLEPAKP